MKTIVVHEFEKVNEDILKEKMLQKGIHVYNNEFNKLINCVDDLTLIKDDVDPYEFLSIKKDRKLGFYVTFKNYIGLIKISDNFQIEILPKIEMCTTDKETKNLLVKMLNSLKEFNGKEFRYSNVDTTSMNINEIFINMYLQEVTYLVKKGLKASYVSLENNLNVLKGKINFKEQLKVNCSHRERVFVNYDEYDLDRSENKIIKSTLVKLLSFISNTTNKRLCLKLLTYFEKVNISNNYAKDFANITFNRENADYVNLINWSKVFLKNKGFASFSGENRSKIMLFPMEKIFESYVAKCIKQSFSDYEIKIQNSSKYLFEYPTKIFALRPDIILKMNGVTKIIFDTKWKKLTDNIRGNYGISQGDIYQMYAYAKKYSVNDVFMLYPLNNNLTNKKVINFSNDENITIHIFLIDVLNIKESLKNLKDIVLKLIK